MRRAHLAGVEGGREERRRDAPGLERLHLIRHQRDERGDDEGRAGQHRGGELVDQALAAARGRDQQEPPALEQGLDRLALAGAKARVPEPGERRVEARRVAARCLARLARLRPGVPRASLGVALLPLGQDAVAVLRRPVEVVRVHDLGDVLGQALGPGESATPTAAKYWA